MPHDGDRQTDSVSQRVLAVALTAEVVLALPPATWSRPGSYIRSVTIEQLPEERLTGPEAPALVLSPLLTPAFDALDLARMLTQCGYRGRYLALVDRLPSANLIRREVEAQSPGLNFDVIVLDGSTAVALALATLRRRQDRPRDLPSAAKHSSIPTDMRKNPSLIPSAARPSGVSPRCDDEAGWLSVVPTSPSVGAKAICGIASTMRLARGLVAMDREAQHVAVPPAEQRLRAGVIGVIGAAGVKAPARPSAVRASQSASVRGRWPRPGRNAAERSSGHARPASIHRGWAWRPVVTAKS